MAEAVLFNIAERILANLGSSTLQAIGSIRGVKEELGKLETAISSIKAVLLDAEEKRISNHQVRDWLQKLEDAVYDADELVDEFHTEALRRRVTPGGGKVRKFFSSSNQIAFRAKMGRGIKKIRENLDEIRANRSFYLMERIEGTRGFSARMRDTHSFVRQEEVIGRNEDKMRIVQLLLDYEFEENVSVISIAGMGGLGKTTLAQFVFNDEKVQNHFELRMWIYVTDVFALRLVVEKIIKSPAADKGLGENLEMDQLQNRLREEIEGKRYLLVLDDVWTEDLKE